MGILNVTPDSFSGDGLSLSGVRSAQVLDALSEKASALVSQGADILDVGGESTRPGSMPVDPEEEVRRVVPGVRRLALETTVPISVDTSKFEVARHAVAAGATLLNDVWGLRKDSRIGDLAADKGLPIVLMHNQTGTVYRDLVPKILEDLAWSIEKAVACGVGRDRIIVDPGFGFGKTAEHNLEIVRRLDAFRALGRPVLLGPSRKSTIGLVLSLPVDDRLEGTAAVVAFAITKGVDIIRVHDVRQMARVARMTDALTRGWVGPGSSHGRPEDGAG